MRKRKERSVDQKISRGPLQPQPSCDGHLWYNGLHPHWENKRCSCHTCVTAMRAWAQRKPVHFVTPSRHRSNVTDRWLSPIWVKQTSSANNNALFSAFPHYMGLLCRPIWTFSSTGQVNKHWEEPEHMQCRPGFPGNPNDSGKIEEEARRKETFLQLEMNESKPNQERSSKQTHSGNPPKSFHFQSELLQGRANQVQRDVYFLKKD